MKIKAGGRIKKLGDVSLILLVLIGLVLGCSVAADVKSIDISVAKIHELMNEGKFEEISEMLPQEVKTPENKKKMRQIFSDTVEKLGKIKESSKKLANGSEYDKYEVDTNYTRITVSYHTTFSNAKAVEEFKFQINDDKAELLAYNIQTDSAP